MERFEKDGKHERTQGDARQYIEAVRMQIAQMGANDSEFSDLDKIIRQLEDGEITPLQAMQQADGLRDSKQSYH